MGRESRGRARSQRDPGDGGSRREVAVRRRPRRWDGLLQAAPRPLARAERGA